MLPRSSWLERYLKVRRRCLVHYFCIALLCGCSVSDRHFQGALSFVCLAGCLFRGAASLLHRLFPKGDAVTCVWEHVAKNPRFLLLAFAFLFDLVSFDAAAGLRIRHGSPGLLLCLWHFSLPSHRQREGRFFLWLPFCLALLAFSVFSASQLQAISVHSRFCGLMLGTFGALRG